MGLSRMLKTWRHPPFLKHWQHTRAIGMWKPSLWSWCPWQMSCSQWDAFWKEQQGLSSLMLRQCGLTGPGAAPLKFLCETLVSLPFKNLLTLDLSMNALCLEGANFLGEFLQCTPQLQTLLLGGNGLGPAGLAALVRSLSQLPLSTLDLSLNGLGTTGVETLLPAGLQLQSLNLRGNWFGSSHSEIIVHLLQSMSATLVKLDISRPGLKGSGRS